MKIQNLIAKLENGEELFFQLADKKNLVPVVFLSEKEAAEHFEVTPRTIRNWRVQGKIKSKKYGSKWYYKVK